MSYFIKFFLLFLVLGCAHNHKPNKIIRIISSGLVLDGGTIEINYLDEKLN